MGLRLYVIEIRNPDGSVLALGRASCLDDEAAKRVAARRVKKHPGALNLYGELIVHDHKTGRAVYRDDDPPSVEDALRPSPNYLRVRKPPFRTSDAR